MDSFILFLSQLFPDMQHLGVAGYWIVLLLSLIESFVITGWFVPGTTVVVIFGGFAAHGFYDFWDLVFFAFVGAVLGDGISYEMGRRGKRFIARYSVIARHAAQGGAFFQKYQTMSIVFGRFVGWVRPIIPFIAGMFGMPRIRFYVANVISGYVWGVVYLGAGYLFGAAWKTVFVHYEGVGLLVLAVLLSGVLLLRFMRKSVGTHTS